MTAWGKGTPAANGNARAVGRHMAAHPHHWLAALVAVVVVLAVAVAFGIVRDNTGGNAPPAGGPQGAAGAPSAGTSPSGTTSPTRDAVDPTQAAIARCRSDWNKEVQPLNRAADALAQWGVHVDAMNQLVAGQISLGQAQTFWNGTRVAAAAHVAQFEKSLGAFRKGAEGCPGSATGQPAATKQLRSCAAGVRARRHAIETAATAVATWQHHVNDMEMLRMGQMTPAHATAMWLKNWRLGQKQLDAYHHALAAARTAPQC